MKKRLLVCLVLFIGFIVNAQIIEFKDLEFKKKLLESRSYNDIAKNKEGMQVSIDTNNDGEIDVEEAKEISILNIRLGLYIKDINELTFFSELSSFFINSSQISELNLLKQPLLKTLTCYGSQNLKEIDISRNRHLTHLTLIDTPNESLNLENNLDLTYLRLGGNGIKLKNIDISNQIKLDTLTLIGTYFSQIDISKNINLRKIDLGGISIKELNLSQNKLLEDFRCQCIRLETLDLSKNILLETIHLQNTKITSIDISDKLKLKGIIIISNSELQSLDLSKNELLAELWCASNPKLKSLDLSNNLLLKDFNCFSDSLKSLDLSTNILLTKFVCNGTALTSLDLSNNINLKEVTCRNGNLVYLNIKNGYKNTVYLEGNSNLKYICADEDELEYVLSRLDKNTTNPVLISSYCDFKPGGTYHTLKGITQVCGNEAITIPNVKFKVTDGTNTAILISNTTGNYDVTIPTSIQTSTHTITPTLENLAYYKIVPESFTITLPIDKDITIKDFCITPIANINDLEITIVPFGVPARPGFDAQYKIIYKNKGTTILSGTIDLKFDDTILDYLSSTQQNTSNSTDNLLFGYTDLKPFETRVVTVTFNVNSPMETPAVNGGDVLQFTATINPIPNDQTPNDNIFTLRQTVVNSYDPNDKTCLEGTEVLQEMIGEYVHYKIRFENTGTFPAENIVVVDEIDQTKFDINTLVPLNASHNFQTKIKDHKVEFIFENIQLPFDDANNDGYIVFKIKTKPTLKLGDSFSNQASIYFDFNFPIITNNETTTIVEEHLATVDFDFNQELTAYPNPVQDRLYITSNNKAIIQSLAIYSLQGQLIQSVPQVTKMSFDVSNLPKGIYIVKVKTDKGNTTTKIVKE